MKSANINSSSKQFAFVSAIFSTLFLILAGITSVLAITVPSLIFGFLLAPIFISLMVCIHHFCEEKMKLFAMLGVIFSIMYGVLISFNYYLQMTLMQAGISGLDLLSMSNPDSIMWVIEILGYFFMGLATLALVPVFTGDLVERLIQILFAVNGILGVGGLIGYALRMDLEIMYAGLVVWNIIMPIATALLALYFRNMKG